MNSTQGSKEQPKVNDSESEGRGGLVHSGLDSEARAGGSWHTEIDDEFDRIDSNRDGVIDREEFKRAKMGSVNSNVASLEARLDGFYNVRGW